MSSFRYYVQDLHANVKLKTLCPLNWGSLAMQLCSSRKLVHAGTYCCSIPGNHIQDAITLHNCWGVYNIILLQTKVKVEIFQRKKAWLVMPQCWKGWMEQQYQAWWTPSQLAQTSHGFCWEELFERGLLLVATAQHQVLAACQRVNASQPQLRPIEASDTFTHGQMVSQSQTNDYTDSIGTEHKQIWPESIHISHILTIQKKQSKVNTSSTSHREFQRSKEKTENKWPRNKNQKNKIKHESSMNSSVSLMPVHGPRTVVCMIVTSLSQLPHSLHQLHTLGKGHWKHKPAYWVSATNPEATGRLGHATG